VGLILRGVAFEYRSKRSDPTWRKRWDAAIVVGSFIPALLWGVAFANIVRGVPMKSGGFDNSLYDGGFFNLLNPYALVGGLTTLTLFMTHGAIFLALKTDGEIRERANKVAGQIGLVATVIAVVFLLWTQLVYSDKAWTWALVVVAAVAWLAGLAMNRAGREGWSFLFSAITLGGAVIYLFSVLYPNVMPASNDPALSLTIWNASSTDYTLKIMTIVAVVFTPIVLAYQSWTYWVFRKRVSPSQISNADEGSLDLPEEKAQAGV
jgi:cytochrome d ubiquinol oxidase subunit II